MQTLVHLLAALSTAPPSDVPGLVGVLGDALADAGRDEDAAWVRDVLAVWVPPPGERWPPPPDYVKRDILDWLTVPCPRCGGAGLYSPDDGWGAQDRCPDCRGRGFHLRP